MRWIVAVLASLAWMFGGGAGGILLGQVPRPETAGDRERTESEARGQAAEADRLFKQRDFAAALPFYTAERAARAALGDLRYEAYALRAIGCCHDRLGGFEAPIEGWTGATAIDSRREGRGVEGYDRLFIGPGELPPPPPRGAAEGLAKGPPPLATGL